MLLRWFGSYGVIANGLHHPRNRLLKLVPLPECSEKPLLPLEETVNRKGVEAKLALVDYSLIAGYIIRDVLLTVICVQGAWIAVTFGKVGGLLSQSETDGLVVSRYGSGRVAGRAFSWQ